MPRVKDVEAFADRAAAGDALALLLGDLATERDVVVLGIARGGVVVAQRIAETLNLPMDAIIARKIGVPGVEEVALGAIAEGSEEIVGDAAWYLGVPDNIVARLTARERVEVERRVRLYRGARRLPRLRGRIVLLVDDGIATGATLRAATRAVRAHQPRRIIVAVPVASRTGRLDVAREVDR